MRYFGWSNTGETNAYQQTRRCVSETTFAVQNPAGICRHQSNLCTIKVPLHDEHAFDTHLLAARRRHRQKRVVTGADRGTTEPTGFIRGIPVFPGPPLTLGAIQRWMQMHLG
jgi:hypothetical protein